MSSGLLYQLLLLLLLLLLPRGRGGLLQKQQHAPRTRSCFLHSTPLHPHLPSLPLQISLFWNEGFRILSTQKQKQNAL